MELSVVEKDISRKIAVEQNIIQGATNMKKKTNNVMVIQKCNTNIREARQNIDYLQETLSKLRLESSKTKNDEEISKEEESALQRKKDVAEKGYGYLSTISPNEHVFSRLDLVKYDCPSLSQRIQYMLQQLALKLQVEKQYQEANNKLTKLYQIDGDQRSSSAAEGGAFESKQRILLLKKALKKYKAINVDLDQYKHHDSEEMDISQPKFRRKQLTGVLTIGLTAIRDVDHIQSPMFARTPESYITIKIDDTVKARSKPSRNDRWSEEFQITVGKGNEVEITVYDKVNEMMTPVAVMWLLLSDIAEAIRKKKANQTNEQQGWVSAQDVSGSRVPGREVGTADTSSNALKAMSTGSTLTEHSASETAYNSPDRVTTNQWFILEPAGQILLTLGFHKTSQQPRKNLMGGLHRHGAIIDRNEEVFEQHGHHFVQKSFYNIMCCAYCGEFLRYTGFQCQDCKFLCHKKCYTNIVTKCIAKTSHDEDSDEAKLNHRIPHRFLPAANRGTKWCCHCGYILPWGKTKVRKCSECGVMCHAQCAHLVPDFCGMSMEMANKILKTIQDTQRNQEKRRRVPPSVNASSSITAVSHPKMADKNEGKRISLISQQSATKSEEYHEDMVNQRQSTYSVKNDTPNNLHDETSDRVNNYVERNDPYLNFTSNVAKEKESPVRSNTTRTLDPMARIDSGVDVPQANYDNLERFNVQNDRDFGYQGEDDIWEEKRIRMEKEIEVQREQDYKDYTREFDGPVAIQPTERYVQQDADYMEDEHEHTVDTTASNPFREMNNETFQMEQQQIAKNFVTSEKNAGENLPDIAAPLLEHSSPQKSYSSPKHKKRQSKRRKVSLDNFILLKVLGKGNFGKVILSKSKNTGSLCAIKVLKKDNIIQNHDIESARAEKKVFLLATETRHPFLTNLFCSFQTENRIYFAMEFIGGGDLMWHVQNQRLSVRRAKFYAAEVLLALKFFHSNGVIYRDLKLENILLTSEGHIKIADYGLCKDEMWYGNKTSTFCGTPEFMAPEILKDQEYSRAVDWWAFGVLLYQMLLCQSPFSGDDEDEVFNAILTDEPLYPIDMAGDIVQIFQGLLAKDPEHRLGAGPRDALEVMEEPFFRNINFDDILQLKVKPPYIPEIKSAEDTSYFEQEFTSAPPTLTPIPSVLTTTQQEEFRGFSFMPEELEL
ncbi:protein kinase C KNAG_0C04310 [Huiozyma naganishii CBS 8797]|uniref:protein kinase C n=1 Tax=Huiozyma naganishii (strain ATCC MYA-139 / BCRC 22969 / CBS 8797 / KCTC 17520 / NBRC 10181 / NCYC 3082 / Yp74L-3) TaxID=1071383 RepID=J7RJ46_HUIN7|nr:hypothetical protein KNAG_0C04310 [Kazachstania naganishii CBS 8797]CCK69533.1 hypothetical protein KNAG_0C04310 [Kazachstania naganishii CBS 8797]